MIMTKTNAMYCPMWKKAGRTMTENEHTLFISFWRSHPHRIVNISDVSFIDKFSDNRACVSVCARLFVPMPIRVCACVFFTFVASINNNTYIYTHKHIRHRDHHHQTNRSMLCLLNAFNFSDSFLKIIVFMFACLVWRGFIRGPLKSIRDEGIKKRRKSSQ